MNDQEPKITDISIYIAGLQATFRPAQDARHTTHWFSTDEVYSAIKRLDPAAAITKEQLFKAMTDAGFKFQNRLGASGCDFRWMLQVRNPK
jgi:putative peptidyl-prolyl cis-trans isomerse D|nr:MAG TPA: hypothetical protein [Caudoviricetes sp.]